MENWEVNNSDEIHDLRNQLQNKMLEVIRAKQILEKCLRQPIQTLELREEITEFLRD